MIPKGIANSQNDTHTHTRYDILVSMILMNDHGVTVSLCVCSNGTKEFDSTAK